MNAVLAIAVIISGSPKNALFAGVIITNTLIGVIQEVRAKTILEKLALLNMTRVNVKRDGKEKDIGLEELVLDDVVILKPGTKIVADGEIMYGNEIEVDEALLTGESDPVLKKEGDAVYAGSFVVMGSGYKKVTKVGADTYAAKLVEEAKKFKLLNSELQKSVNQILKVIIWLVFPISILLITTQIFFAKSTWQDAVIRAVTGIVGMVPEGLVLLTSATFVVAIIRLSKWKALVQELPATEVLARVDVLCLDKTGTITEGTLKLDRVEPIGPYSKEKIDNALAGLAHAFPNINPTQQAILKHYPQSSPLHITHKIPFSSKTKWMGVTFEQEGAWILGAPEVILENRYGEIQNQVEEEAMKGRRVLLLAHLQTTSFQAYDFKRVVTGALLFIEDIIREEAPKALQYFEKEGVTIKIISGDNPVTVSAVAQRAGVIGAEQYIDARTLPEGQVQFAEILEKNTVFGRVTPHQKKLMVTTLQAKGHTVAMTGDGVNDVLALKEADCGIAMANASDATKAVAQLVLLQSNFSALPEIVAEGRRLINNLERVSELFLTKTAYSIILSLICGLFFIPYPFQPIQLTLIGSLAIGIPAFFLALKSNTDIVQKGFLKRILTSTIPNGVVLSLGVLVTFLLGHLKGVMLQEIETLVVIILGGGSFVVLARIIRPYTMLNVSVILTMSGIFAGTFFVPFTRKLFSLTMVERYHVFFVIGVVVLMWPFISIVRGLWYKCLNILKKNSV
ncbi:HAD-IC family P-type ATPase [Bacillus sp. CDB3]|uniref:HAD-IC family P-type ATPase n=1 Tax=Bacillus sp. CDB3 TaxID=360310 RepID=UPI001C4E04FA|nr:HAD-IC family P-type ATPase [Bacillus sp. CDB3]